LFLCRWTFLERRPTRNSGERISATILDQLASCEGPVAANFSQRFTGIVNLSA